MNSFMHIDKKGKYILILGEEPTQRLDEATLAAKHNILLVLHNQEKDLY